MTTTTQTHGGGAQPASIDTSGKVTGGAALRVYGFDSEADAQAAGYVCEGGPAMSVALITDAQIASGAWRLEGDPSGTAVYTAPSNMPVEGGYAVPVYPVNGWGSTPAPVALLFVSAEIGTVNAFTIPVTFDQDVSASDFTAGVTIKVGSTATSIISATRQSNHAIVYYVIPVLWHGSADPVTWEYDSGSGNIVSEADSTPLGNVSAQSVMNNVEYSTVPGTDIQSDSGVTTSVDSYSGTGTITQSGTAISGSGTKFLSEILVGDRVTASGIDGIVQSVAGNANLILDTSATVAVGIPFNITPQSGTARVTALADQTPGAAHGFTQATASSRPSQQTISGHTPIVFSGPDNAGDSMIGGNWADNLGSFAIIMATNGNEGGPDVSAIISKINGYFGDGWLAEADSLMVQGGGGMTYYIVAGDNPNGLHVFSLMKHSNSSMNIYRDGVIFEVNTFDGGPVESFTTDKNVVLGSTAIGDQWFFGALYGLLLVSPEPSATNRAALEARLAARYGITL